MHRTHPRSGSDHLTSRSHSLKVFVKQMHFLQPSDFMRSVARAYDTCTPEGSSGSGSDMCAGNMSVCCPFVSLSGNPKRMVPAWGVPHSIGHAIEHLVFKHRMVLTLEIGMLQGNTAFHILHALARIKREQRSPKIGGSVQGVHK